MNIIEIILIAIGLALDAFTVSLVVSAAGYTKHPSAIFRLSFHFGLFQFFMPILGWLLGISVIAVIASFDHWLAFALLAFVGIRMLCSGIHPDTKRYKKDPSHGYSLLVLCIATSIDAFAIGLSLAFLKINIMYPCIVIGVVAALLSLLGIKLGNRLNARWGYMMEVIGGVILILIGVRIVTTHIF